MRLCLPVQSVVLYLDVTSSAKSPLNTGIQRVVRGLFAALRGRGAVAPLVWNNVWETYCRLAPREEQYLTDPFHRYRSPTARPEKLGVPSLWSEAARHLRHRRHRFPLERIATPRDVLLVPEIFQDKRTTRLAAIKSWFPGRCYAVFHDAVPLRAPEMTTSRELRTFPRYVRALASFDKVICPSQEAKADLEFYWESSGARGCEPSVQPWPTDFGRDRVVVAPCVDRKRILCVASLHPRKNHLTLLAAAEQLWSEALGFDLILIGRTTLHWGPTVTAEIELLARKGRPVRWMRHVDDHALHQAYGDCSFTVYPSLREGFGLPILESLWYGRPCVCGSNGALGEAARGGGCLLVNQADPSSLAEAMRQLLTDDRIYDRLQEEARNRTFRSWDHYGGEFLKELQISPA